LNLPITLIIMDNQGYASIRNTQRNYFESRYIATGSNSGLHIPDLGSIAEAIGIRCISIESLERLKPSLQQAIQTEGPTLCIVRLVPDESLWPKAAAIPQTDGTMLSMPLEDMTPLLPMDALEHEMLIPPMPQSYHARQSLRLAN
jgi:acetolactate synthase-1/2/3 large subunit